jgi:flagellar protein FliO/FliZ
MPPVVAILNRNTLAIAALIGLAMSVASADAQPPVAAPSAGTYPSAYRSNPAPESRPAAQFQNRLAGHAVPAALPVADHVNASHTPATPNAVAPDSAGDVQASRPMPARSAGATAGSLADDGSRIPQSPIMSLTTVLSGLAIVLGLFLVVAWLFKRAMPKGAGSLPSEVVEVLGRTALAPRQMVHLIRVGQKMLLVSISAAGVETLTEITDPLEVDRLAGICGQSSPQSATSAFRHVFQQFSQESTPAGFLGDTEPKSNESANRTARPEVTHG